MALKDLRSMFALKRDEGELSASKSVPLPTIDYANPDAIQQGETYNHYGMRMCGKVAGGTSYLTPFLQRVYTSEKQRQANDAARQEAARQNIQNQINDKQAEQEKTSNAIAELEDKIHACNNRIEEWREKISRLINAGNQGKNKEAKIKMILGCTILVPLTVYLFVFYSSTFYSAFFRDFAQGNIGLGTAMLDPQAIPAAFNDGIVELFFILAAPVIFLGLGFSLHFFTLQKNNMKYLKMAAIILVTFIFDCILAYLIGKKIHDVQLIYTDLPPYTIGEAIGDPNIWAIIFCGFVVYIIWGIVFDMTMTAYNDYASNKTSIEKYEKQIEDEQGKIAQLKSEKTAVNNKKIELNSEIAKLQQSLSTSITHYDMGEIKSTLAQFFAGWMSTMSAFNPEHAETAKEIYNQNLNVFFKSEQQ